MSHLPSRHAVANSDTPALTCVNRHAGTPDDRHEDPADPLLGCMDCGELFLFSSSIDEDRCDRCATAHAQYLGRVVA